MYYVTSYDFVNLLKHIKREACVFNLKKSYPLIKQGDFIIKVAYYNLYGGIQFSRGR